MEKKNRCPQCDTVRNRCPQCNTTQVYLRIKNSSFLCRVCGNMWFSQKLKKVAAPKKSEILCP